ncbi:hypothetical protein ASC61_05225 [Aeromicrobium sp. Root344]|uniref:hypothetical protein n=1 Tax=Aeromicrobium sp. Root344 TaxID=1736521 RepID=UPI0006F6DC01|nr:hypothetical protein [Aeromicrobium sp. Root344]KQV74450.1 hypothetical protein ASC61_05225 [Aeromicrobium sp. Root344]
MVDEQQPAKKVVKRVVKKTVVRPAAPPPAETVRYGRPVSTTRSKPQAKVASRAGAKPAGTTKTRPRVKVGAAGKALTSRGAGVASGVAGATGSAARATGDFVADRYHALKDWRVPHIDPRLAAPITGLVVGLVSVGLGLVALEIFNDVRGVASGGKQWGSLTFVVVTFIAMLLGDVLLRAFGTTRAGLISFLAVVLAIVAILGLFLEMADDQRAFVLVPALAAVTYFVSHWLITVAESSPTLPE